MDCLAGVEILKRILPKSGRTVLTALMQEAQRVTVRLWAEKAPYSKKDLLKARGSWSNGEHGTPRAWFIDVSGTKVAVEKEFLESQVFGQNIEIPTSVLNPANRFSTRIPCIG